MELRYSGDTLQVSNIITDDFQYLHIPYVGLGIHGHYVDGSFLITSIIDDSNLTLISPGDRIFEFNGATIDSSGLNINGTFGEVQTLIVTKNKDSTFQVIKLPLSEFQHIENKQSFLSSMIDYSNVWYEYDLIIKEIILSKRKIAIHYKWEGTKNEFGEIFSFSAMEFITLNKKRNQIQKIEGLWSEKQFRDQFK
tara:strand:+ start:142 stop:726 length:585 start_codon:yes stop_codon:yes gene_type:complete